MSRRVITPSSGSGRECPPLISSCSIGDCAFCNKNADFDNNGTVNALDNFDLLSKYGICSDSNCTQYDLNCDSIINEEDTNLLLTRWGKTGELN